MGTNTYPSLPLPAYSYATSQQHKTLISSFGTGAELRNVDIRFPKRSFTLRYQNILLSSRNIIQNFMSQQRGQLLPFWYIDLSLGSAQRSWKDEYVGRGGPLPIDGAVLCDFSGPTYTDFTVAINESTAGDVQFLPSSQAASDAFYVGCSVPFDEIITVLSQLATGSFTITWQYWNGSSWVTTGISGSSGAVAFKASGTIGPWTMPSDWVDCYPSDTGLQLGASTSRLAYWVRGKITTFSSSGTQPLGTSATVNTKTYDLHVVGGASGTTSIYVDDVLKTGGGTDYTYVTGGGGGGSDRITFTGYQTAGSLITSNFTGRLRIKGRFGSDELSEEITAILGSGEYVSNIEARIAEIQW